MTRLRLFHRLIVRPLLRDPIRTGLLVLAVALGVAVALAIDLAGTAAAGSFRASVESLTGDADLEVTATGGVPEQVVGTLARLPYPIEVRARIENYATVVDSGATVPLFGIDLISDRSQDSSGPGELAAIGEMNGVWVDSELGKKPGDSIRLQIGDRVRDYAVRGLLKSNADSGDWIVMDIATAERELNETGRVDRILIKTPQQPGIEEWQRRLGAALPAGATIAPQGSRTRENRRMLEAFRWNLRVLSYIALVVGAFLIYNAISVSVVRRRAEIGILRALGATRTAVLAAFLSEAACFGLAGGLLGLLIGRAMATGAVRLISVTVESLYVSSRPAPIELTLASALTAVGIGLCVSIASALSPAREASLASPTEAMARGRIEFHARVHKIRDLWIALALGLSAAVASRFHAVGGKPLFGYLSALLLIGASAFAIPALVEGVTLLSSDALKRVLGVEAMLASRSLAASLRRTSVLVGALSTAIAMVTAVGIMVGSFRETVQTWMENQLLADLYLRPAGAVAADRHPVLSGDIETRLRSLPGVAAVDAVRAFEVDYDGLPAMFGASEHTVSGRFSRARFLSGRSPGVVFPLLHARDAAIVSEPFANKHNLRAGDRITLPLGGRRVTFQIVDIYYDYASERGAVIVDRDTMLAYLPDPGPSNLAVYIDPGADLDSVRKEVERAVAGRNVAIFSNRTLRRQAILVFDRTFAITYALEAVSIVVAVMGIAGALLALVIDRRREFGLLRFLGAGAGQIRKLILVEAGLLGLLSNLAGLGLGLALSLILIFVINKQSFGWTIQFHSPSGILVTALTLVYAATVLAGLYPARVAVRLNPIEVIHEE